MSRKRFSKAFWHNFRFKYKISVINENTLEEVFNLHLSKLNGLSVLFTTLIAIFVISALILILTPLRNYLPGYMSREMRDQVIRNALKADSLGDVVTVQSLYIMNIQDILRGEVKPDTTGTIEELTTVRKDTLLNRTEREEKFRREYEEAEKFNLTAVNREAEVGGLLFYTPTRGMISSHFDMDRRHPGVDIAANPNESVLSVLNGVVIISSYTAETGYVIGVQHSQGFVSFYKHCGALLKQQGDEVKAGEVIALVGNTGTLTTGSHLHFELWHNGKAVNPGNYIVF